MTGTITLRRDNHHLLPPCVPALPINPSPALAHVLRAILSPHPDIAIGAAEQSVRAEAAEWTLKIRDRFAPATLGVITTFLWPVGDAVEFPPTEDEFFRRVNVTYLSCQDIPYIAWTQEASIRLCRKSGRNMPRVEVIRETVLPPVARLIAYRDALAQVQTA